MAEKYISGILTNKFSLIFVFLLIYKLPIIHPVHFLFFILFLLFVFCIIEFKKKIEFKILILIILIASTSYFLEKKTIIEKHAIFLPASPPTGRPTLVCPHREVWEAQDALLEDARNEVEFSFLLGAAASPLWPAPRRATLKKLGSPWAAETSLHSRTTCFCI